MRQVASSLALLFGLLNLLRHVAPSAFEGLASRKSGGRDRLIVSVPGLADSCRVLILGGRVLPSLACMSKISNVATRIGFESAGLSLLRFLAFSVACPVPDHFPVRFHEKISLLRVAQHFRRCCASF